MVSVCCILAVWVCFCSFILFLFILGAFFVSVLLALCSVHLMWCYCFEYHLSLEPAFWGQAPWTFPKASWDACGNVAKKAGSMEIKCF